MQDLSESSAVRPLYERRGSSGVEAAFDSHRFAALIVLGILSFGVWIAVVVNMAPHRLITYTLFFVPFWVFTTSLVGAGLYWLRSSSLLPEAVNRHTAVRQGALVATVLVLNLALLAAHRWAMPVLLVSAACIVVYEFAAWARTPAAN